jgi:ribosomal protein L22
MSKEHDATLDKQPDPVEALLKPDPPKTESEAEKARLPVKSQRKGRSPEAMAAMRKAATAARKIANEKKALEREAHLKETKTRILKAEQEAKAIAPNAEFDEEEEEKEEEVVVAKPKRAARKVKKVVQVVESDDEEDDEFALKQYIKGKAKKYAVKYGGKSAEPSTIIRDAARDQLRSQLSDQVIKAAWANVFKN